MVSQERERGVERSEGEVVRQAHLLSVRGYFNYQNVGNAIVAVAVAAGKTLN